MSFFGNEIEPPKFRDQDFDFPEIFTLVSYKKCKFNYADAVLMFLILSRLTIHYRKNIV